MANQYIRVVHLEAVHCDVQVQTPGVVHVPPFEHVGEQIATNQKNSRTLRIFLSSSITPVVHLEPVHPAAHVQTPGLAHVPPFEQIGVHTAIMIRVNKCNSDQKHFFSLSFCSFSVIQASRFVIFSPVIGKNVCY